MDNHIYKQIEITGSSPESSDAAVANAIAHAGRSVREMKWFEVTDVRGDIQEDRVAHWQVSVKIGFRLDN